MATGALDANGVWQYGEDDSEATFSALLNKLGASTSTQVGKRKVLQIVTGTTTTSVNNNTTTYADTGLSATITPSSTSSKILVMIFHGGVVKYDGAAASGINFRLLRNSSPIITIDTYVGYTNTTARNQVGSWSATYSDTPASTSAQTYKTQFSNTTNTTGVGVQNSSGLSTMLLVEVI
jgi:hypothetical protein